MGQVAWAVENNFLNLFVRELLWSISLNVALMVSASALTATLTTLFIGRVVRPSRRHQGLCGGRSGSVGDITSVGLRQSGGSRTRFLPDTAGAAASSHDYLRLRDDVLWGKPFQRCGVQQQLTGVTDRRRTNRGRVEGVNFLRCRSSRCYCRLWRCGNPVHVGDDSTVTTRLPSLFVAWRVLVGAAAVVTASSCAIPTGTYGRAGTAARGDAGFSRLRR